MKVGILLCVLCVFAVNIFIAPVLGQTVKPVLSVPPEARQGDCFFVALTGVAQTAAPMITWDNKKFPMVWQSDHWQAILPAAADTATGWRQVWVSWQAGESRQRLCTRINLSSRNFGIQHLTLAPQQESLYTQAGVEEEYRLIGEALKQFTLQALWQGEFMVPVKGRKSTPFGIRRIRNGKKQGIHKGIDYGAPLGTPVVAANDGVVALTADNFQLHGKTVVIDHGLGVCTLYLHLSEILVKPGQKVKKGEIIAKVGSTGVATGPHLHYALYVGGVAVNPAWWESAAR